MARHSDGITSGMLPGAVLVEAYYGQNVDDSQGGVMVSHDARYQGEAVPYHDASFESNYGVPVPNWDEVPATKGAKKGS